MTRLDPRERAFVINRDRECVVAKWDRSHVCRDAWGNAHDPTDLVRLTVDHVHRHKGGTKGKRPPHRREFMVAMDYAENVRPPSAKTRQRERDYLEDLYPGVRCCSEKVA